MCCHFDTGAGIHIGPGVGGGHSTAHPGGGGRHPHARAAQPGASLPQDPL